MTKEFCMKEVSTSEAFILNDIGDKNNIVVIDNTRNRNFDALLNKCSIVNRKKIYVVYLCHQTDGEIHELLKTFGTYFIIDNTDFIGIIYQMKKQFKKDFYFKHHIHARTVAILKQIQMNQNNFGFKYLKRAIILKTFDDKLRMKDLCVLIAKRYRTTSGRVDRCMRTALISSIEKNKQIFIETFEEDKMSPMTLITIVSNDLRKELSD